MYYITQLYWVPLLSFNILFFIFPLSPSGAGRGGPHRQPRPHSGGPKTSSESAPPNGVVAKKPLRYDSDFDFDIANALFSKETIEKEIKEKLKITTGDRPQATGDEAAAPLRWEGPGEEVGGASEGLLQEEEDPVQSYDKEVSFFDNISCEANTSNKWGKYYM